MGIPLHPYRLPHLRSGEEESSPQMKGMNDMERAAHVDKIRKREQDRKAAYGTLDEPPDELVAVLHLIEIKTLCFCLIEDDGC